MKNLEASRATRICVILHTSRGLFIPVMFNQMTTGLQMKETLQARRGYHPDTQTLVYRNQIIHNKDHLRDHDVGDNCTVKVMLEA